MKYSPRMLIGLTFWLVLGLVGCKSEPAVTVQDLTARFEEAGLEVAEPDYGPLNGQIASLESGINQLPGAPSRPQMKTVQIDGVLTTIHRFENADDAKRFFELIRKMPQAGAELPARMKAALGTPRYLLHKNIVLRLNEGAGGEDDSAATAAIEQQLERL